MGRHHDETTHVPEHRFDAICSLGKPPCDTVHQDSVEPPFQNRRLPRPPGGMNKHEGLAPAQILDMSGKFGMTFKFRGQISGVRQSFVGGEDRIETFGPQIAMAHLVSPGCEFGKHDIAQVSPERIRRWMRVNDEDPHRATALSTLARNFRRSSSDAVSIAYRPTWRHRARHRVDDRNARTNVRRPLSLIALTYDHGDPYVLATMIRRT